VQPVVIVGGSAAQRDELAALFGEAQLAAVPTEELDDSARPQLLVITGDAVLALVREARGAPHLTDVPVLVVLPARREFEADEPTAEVERHDHEVEPEAEPDDEVDVVDDVVGDDDVEEIADRSAETPAVRAIHRRPAPLAGAAQRGLDYVDAVLEAGATDVIRMPLSPRLLRARAETLLTAARRVGLAPIPTELIAVNDVLTQHGDDADALVAVLEVVQQSLVFERASLVAYIEGSDHGFVIAATDAPTRFQFTLAMAEYPEILHAVKTGTPVLIDDVITHPLTMHLGAMLAERGVRGSAVLPVQWRGRVLGVMLLRRSTPGVGHVAGRGIELAQLVTSITAAHLRHGPVLASLREQTHRISRDRYEAERRLRGIDSLKEHFEAGTDGVVVLDEGGRILFVNRAAERITGYARDGLIGSLLTEQAPLEQRALIEDATTQVLAGANVAPFDLSLNTTLQSPVRVSVSTSTVLAGTGAVIFSFRDVTAERKLENELRSTKEFLERLIDSTVDAIIAADLHGTIILFNQGAERLFGYRAEDIIGKRPVWDLYDRNAARQIMRMLRSNAYGGGGRLDATRREVRIHSGEMVPVNMTAAIIYEGGEEVATVGILTDLRERIRMEQRLAQAQRQLQLTEKQALVAELAGAAAHELNQPLTSILGYCELLKRQNSADAPHMRAVGVIANQSERMAAIVKKIGRLTKYETTDYVGTERILDLDRAAAADADTGLVIDPVEEGQTGEFTAVLPGGLAAALGRDDFDLMWPVGTAPATAMRAVAPASAAPTVVVAAAPGPEPALTGTPSAAPDGELLVEDTKPRLK
jgi:PAS domain S-box-containing protein